MKRREVIKVIHNAPGKRGKQEYREFKTLEEATAYFERNRDWLAGTSAADCGAVLRVRIRDYGGVARGVGMRRWVSRSRRSM